MFSSRQNLIVSWLVVGVWSFAMLWLAVAGGVQHDYTAYLAQWQLVLDGQDPWSTDNAYGPLHNLLAYLLPHGELAPKMAMVGALLVANAVLFGAILHTQRGDSPLGVYALAILTNVLVVSVGVIYGLNDALVAALVVAAVVSRWGGFLLVSGASIGLAVLLKYYPAILIPLFALEGGRLRWRLVAGAAAAIAVGLAAAMATWGPSFLNALTFGAERRPKLLSILAAFNSYPSLVGGQSVVDFLLATNALLVVAVGAGSVVVAMKTSLHWLEASVLGLLAVLLAYKTGHQQFYLPWLFLVAALPLAGTRSAARLAWITLPLVLFLSAYQWGYAYGSDGYRETLGVVRRSGGFLALALGVATIVVYFRTTPAMSVEKPAGLDEPAIGSGKERARPKRRRMNRSE